MKRIAITAGWILAVISLSTCAFLREIIEPMDVMELLDKDTIPPVLTITSPTNGQEVGGTWMLQGTVSDEGSGVNLVIVQLDDGDQISITVSSGRWSREFSSSVYGWHTNHVFAQDKAGNSVTAEVYVERTSIPAVVVQSPFDGQAISSNTFVIQGTASVDTPYVVEWVELSTNGSAFFRVTNVSTSSVSWSFPMTGLVDGSNYIIARTAADNGKTNTTAQILLQVDISDPSFVIASPSGTVTIESNSYIFSGTASDSGSGVKGVYLSVNGSAYHIAGGTTSWSTNLMFPFVQGTNTVLLYAQDWGGNTSATNTRFIIKQARKFLAYDGEASDCFGYNVAISSDGLVIVSGATRDTIGANSYQGSAYVLRWNGTAWLTNKLVAPDGTTNDQFGNSVSISGDGNTVLCGAWKDDVGASDQGSAYVYKWNGSGYVMTNKLVAADGTNSEYFGSSVAVSGDGTTLAIGASDDNIGVSYMQGSVYVYKWNGSEYILTNKLLASDGELWDKFGYSVALSGDGSILAAGAYNDDVGAHSEQGSAYVYQWNGSGYVQTNQLIASDGTNSEYFGNSVSVSEDGNIIAVGAYYAKVGANSQQGAVYIYERNGSAWNEKKLTASDGMVNDHFGCSVSLSADGNSIAIGVSGDDDKGLDSGSVYRFYLDGSVWLTNKMAAYDGVSSEGFGYSVALSGDGNSIVAGACWDDDLGSQSGSMYLIK